MVSRKNKTVLHGALFQFLSSRVLLTDEFRIVYQESNAFFDHPSRHMKRYVEISEKVFQT